MFSSIGLERSRLWRVSPCLRLGTHGFTRMWRHRQVRLVRRTLTALEVRFSDHFSANNSYGFRDFMFLFFACFFFGFYFFNFFYAFLFFIFIYAFLFFIFFFAFFVFIFYYAFFCFSFGYALFLCFFSIIAFLVFGFFVFLSLLHLGP